MYGVDLLDLGGERLSYRRLRNLVERLPEGSSLVRDLRGDDSWSTDTHLLAGIFDAVQVGNYQFAAAHSKPGRQPRPPKPLPRPGAARAVARGRRRTSMSAAEQFARLKAMHGIT